VFSSRLRRCMLAVAVLAVAGAAAGGIAYATSGDGGTLAACAKNENGQLRLDGGGGCAPSEHAVALGTAAATHADERYYAAPRISGGTGEFAVPVGRLPGVLATATPVITMHVAAGAYAVAAQVTAVNFTGSGNLVCLLLDSNNATHGFAGTQLGNGAGFSSQQTITIDGALSLTEDTDLKLTCFSQNFGGSAGDPAIWAADITTKSVDVATITQETH
jgi:hypothetical protein